MDFKDGELKTRNKRKQKPLVTFKKKHKEKNFLQPIVLNFSCTL